MQKPEDIEGQCPFVASEMKCPYGLSCRFYGTHREIAGKENSDSEMNYFNKETQRLLWKNKMAFVKADAKLKSLGLLASLVSLSYLIFCSFTPIYLISTSPSFFLFCALSHYFYTISRGMPEKPMLLKKQTQKTLKMVQTALKQLK